MPAPLQTAEITGSGGCHLSLKQWWMVLLLQQPLSASWLRRHIHTEPHTQCISIEHNFLTSLLTSNLFTFVSAVHWKPSNCSLRWKRWESVMRRWLCHVGWIACSHARLGGLLLSEHGLQRRDEVSSWVSVVAPSGGCWTERLCKSDANYSFHILRPLKYRMPSNWTQKSIAPSTKRLSKTIQRRENWNTILHTLSEGKANEV